MLSAYTVLLLRPDYVADTFGHDTFCAHVEAPNVSAAQAAAQREAVVADSDAGERLHEGYITREMDNYHVLFVTEGHVQNISEDQ